MPIRTPRARTPISGLLIRPQSQGHAHPGRGRPHRLPAPAGAHLPQRPRRLADRLRAVWAELPDRAPPVPLHAPAQPPPLPASGPRLLPAARPRLLPDQPDRLLRPGPTPPEQRRQVGPAAANPGSLTPTHGGCAAPAGHYRRANRRDRLERPDLLDRLEIRWKMSSRTAAPTIAVIQVERLKNPCRLWMWNSLVATQPPSSAPAMPIRQVRIRPWDLLPGISRLASKPATRPRIIQAIMPITDSFSQ